MSTDVKGMGIREYLGQGEYWIDHRNGSVFAISQMDTDRRVSAARNLARMSTALISLAEAEALRQGRLDESLQLAHKPPREWMVSTELYRALYPATEPSTVNRNSGSGVITMRGLSQTA